MTALDPAIRHTLTGLALASVLDRGALSNQAAERADLLKRAGETLAQGASERAFLAAKVGAAEARLEAASIQNSAETSALQIARSGLVGVDQFEAATRLEAAETQLQSLYTITARLSRLSLADYI